MKLTNEQKNVFEGHIALLNKKIGLKVNAQNILDDIYKGLDKKVSFQQAYKDAYANALKNQVIAQIVDKVSNGEQVPNSAGEYLGSAMDYLFDTLADDATKENDPMYNAKKLVEDAEELENEFTPLKKEVENKYKKPKLAASLKITVVESRYAGMDQLEDLLKKAQANFEKVLTDEKKEMAPIDAKLAAAKDYKKTADKNRKQNPHHIAIGDYNEMVSSAVLANQSKLDLMPRYQYYAKNQDKYVQPMLGFIFDNLESDKRTGDLTVEKLMDAIDKASEAYMVVNYKYNQLGFFKKWFTGQGHDLRTEMANIKDPLMEAQKHLIKKAKTAEDLALAKSVNVRDSLHNLGTKNVAIAGQHGLAMDNILDSFNEKINENGPKEENVMNYVIEKTKERDMIQTNIKAEAIIPELDEIGPGFDNNDKKCDNMLDDKSAELEDDGNLFAAFA